jgi:hypothetical protein
MPADAEYDVRLVRYSYRELTEIQAQIIKDGQLLRDRGVTLASVGPRASANRVIVAVTGDVDRAREGLEDYGAAVEVIRGKISRPDCSILNCPPGKAGLGINTAAGATCTLGAWLKRTNGALRMITAGHCFGLRQFPNGDGSDMWWFHNDDRIAKSGGNTWSNHAFNNNNNFGVNPAPTDVGIFQVTEAAFVPNNLNRIIVRDNNNNLTQARITSYRFASTQFEGNAVCRTGSASWSVNVLNCTTIIDANHAQWSCAGPDDAPPCATINHEWKVERDTIGGDSGGPYYTPPVWSGNAWVVQFLGIVTHSEEGPGDDDAWYTPTTWIINGLDSELGVEVAYFCTGPTCPPVSCFDSVCYPQ